MGLIPINERIIEPNETYEVESYGNTVRHLAYPTNIIVESIQRLARMNGFEYPLFTVFSGYRSIADQERLFRKRVEEVGGDEELASKTVARAGRSSHHTGHAFDIYLGHKTGYKIDSSDPENVDYIRTTEAYEFMKAIADTLGITELSNEAWHWDCDRACRDSFVKMIGLDSENDLSLTGASKSKMNYKLSVGFILTVFMYLTYRKHIKRKE